MSFRELNRNLTGPSWPSTRGPSDAFRDPNRYAKIQKLHNDANEA